MRRTLFILITICCACSICTAQELRCHVLINSDQIQGSNKQVFQTLQNAISEYVNNTRWTNLTFAEQEKIDCNMTMIVSSISGNMWTCELQVQAKRPVFNTSYSSPLINFRDEQFVFSYQEYDHLDYQPNNYSSNLTAMLAYYCYLIIGTDMDSYERLGGTPYYQACEDIVNTCQSASMEADEAAGWKAFDSNRNRYALTNNLMDDAFKSYRNFFYEYHRLGLDMMAANAANGRAKIAEGMDVLKQAYRARPSTYLINTFLDAKNDELVNIFKQGTDKEKEQVLKILLDIDPTRQTQYEKINEQ